MPQALMPRLQEASDNLAKGYSICLACPIYLEIVP
jgi:hypothetical protein